MKKILAALLLALSLASPAAARPECRFTLSETDFMDMNVKVGTQVFDASPRAFAGVLKLTNEQRALKPGLWPLEGDKMVVARYKWKNQEGYGIGIVMFLKNCMVPGSAYQIDELEFIDKLARIGLSFDDFKPRG